MRKRKETEKYKYLGVVSKEITDYWKIEEHANKPILVYENRVQHVKEKHLKDFGSIEKILKVYDKLPLIINKPDYVYYNKNTKGLEYYKRLQDNVCVVVRVNNGKALKVKSWYPANSSKLKNRKLKELKYLLEESRNY